MAIYGYFRVSTQKRDDEKEKKRQQDYERQRYLFAHSGITFDRIFEERVSGGVRGDERQAFKEMLDLLKPGDMVVFTESSRFGRDYKDCFDIVDIITLDYEVSIKFISNGMTLYGGKKLNPYEWMALSQFFLADEFQKRIIGFNTSNKLKALKEKGVVLGAPQKISQEVRDNIVEMHKKGISQNKISQLLNVSRTVVSKEVKQCKSAI